MNVRRAGVSLAFHALWIGFLTPRLASTFVHKTFEKAVSDAEGIVHGTVGMSYANWVKGGDGNQRIFTFTELQVEEVLKGEIPLSGKTLVLREMGGEKDGVGLQIPGSAKFKRGEDVVVFVTLPSNPDGSVSVRGMMMGKYNLLRGDDGALQLSGGRIAFGGGGQVDTDHPENSRPIPAKRWTLDALRGLIQDQREQKSSAKTDGSAPTKATSEIPAPALQHSEQKSPEPSRSEVAPERNADQDSWAGRWIWGVLLLAGLAFLILFFLRK